MEQRNRSSIIPHKHQNPNTITCFFLQKLTECCISSRFWSPRISHQHDLSVHRPPRNVYQVLCVVDCIKNIFPTSTRLVSAASRKWYSRNKVVWNMSILVQGNPTFLSLWEVSVRNSGEFRTSDSLAPVEVFWNIEVLELHMDLGMWMYWFFVFVQDFNPSIYFFAVQNLLDGNVCSSDQGCTDWVVIFHCEYDIWCRMSTVNVKRLAPFRICVFFFYDSCSSHACFFQINCCI